VKSILWKLGNIQDNTILTAAEMLFLRSTEGKTKTDTIRNERILENLR
jgi:hypothetical protein